jgi:hypothetical protein
MTAELDGLIASGPRHGNQFTYALLEERAPKARALDRTDAPPLNSRGDTSAAMARPDA